ncbi:MAG: STAS domain-containing protein [Pseudomonadota bacterium]|nr:STAS domain-containing protein [Pseudomonadota bacterium]
MDESTVLYAKQGKTCVLKFTGDIRYTLSPCLDHFIDRLFARPAFDDVLIDLTETTVIDSTILGLLAKIANLLRERNGRRPTLVTAGEDIHQLLDSVGFDAVFTLLTRRPSGLGMASAVDTSEPFQEEELARTVLEAHQILSDLNERNRAAFQSVVDALKNELAGRE